MKNTKIKVLVWFFFLALFFKVLRISIVQQLLKQGSTLFVSQAKSEACCQDGAVHVFEMEHAAVTHFFRRHKWNLNISGFG